MSITVNNRIVAEARIQSVTLRPVVGAYELLFGLDITVNPQSDYARRVSIVGARVSLRADGGSVQPVGFARPESPIDIRQFPHLNRMTPTLMLPLQPGQVAAMERSRDAGDVTFELLVTGVGTDQNGDHPTQDEWRIQIPRSDWLQKLRSAGARDVLLLEVPLPVVDRPKEWAGITKDLQRAEAYFRDGDHRACVALCRTVLDEVGHQKFGKKDWAGPLLDRLSSDRTGMSGGEREAVLWATVRHYAHLARHGASDGGVPHYSRAEAQLLLTMVASLVAFAQTTPT
jgi:hypothetical protein